LKVPLISYENQENPKVFSYVVEVPFTPLDLDIGRLLKELGWNPELDRFRIWNILPITRRIRRHYPYVIIRKADVEGDVMLHCRIDFNHHPHQSKCDEECAWLAISTLCNDDEYPDKFLSLFVDLPPSFHSQEELRVVQREWSSDRSLIEGFRGSLLGARGEKPPEMTPSEEVKIMIMNAKASYFERRRRESEDKK